MEWLDLWNPPPLLTPLKPRPPSHTHYVHMHVRAHAHSHTMYKYIWKYNFLQITWNFWERSSSTISNHGMTWPVEPTLWSISLPPSLTALNPPALPILHACAHARTHKENENSIQFESLQSFVVPWINHAIWNPADISSMLGFGQLRGLKKCTSHDQPATILFCT